MPTMLHINEFLISYIREFWHNAEHICLYAVKLVLCAVRKKWRKKKLDQMLEQKEQEIPCLASYT